MKLRTLLPALALTLSATAEAQSLPAGSYDIDVAHSKVGFGVSHLVIATVEGRFKDFGGVIVIDPKLANSSVEATIQTASIDTGIEQRDEHLRSADFFDVGKPENSKITFKSKKITGSAKSLKVSGDLTIKGVTKSVVLEGRYLGAVKDGFGNEKVAFEFKTQIKRQDFGLTWSQMVEAGPVVGDQVTITMAIQAAKKK